MPRLFLDVPTESALLDEVTQRRQRLSAQRRTVLPQTALLAESYADAYPWMDASAIQSLVQAGVAPDEPQVQQVATLAAQQAAADGDFDVQADDVPDSWLESLGNAVKSFVAPVTRTGFTILMSPFEEVQALLSSAGTAIFDETEAGQVGLLSDPLGNLAKIVGDVVDVPNLISDFWSNYTEKAARSHGLIALSNIIDGTGSGLGEGFLPGGAVFEEREAAKHRLQLDGQFVTPGRLIARQFTEPGTFQWQMLSGLNDFAQNLVLDPVIIPLVKLSKAQKATKAFQTTGVISGLRKTVGREEAVNYFLTHKKGQAVVRALTENTDAYTAWKAIGKPSTGGTDVAKRLAATRSETGTFDVLSRVLGLTVRERPNPRFVNRVTSKSNYGSRFGGGARVATADNSRLTVMGRMARSGDDVDTVLIPSKVGNSSFSHKIRFELDGRKFTIDEYANRGTRTADNTGDVVLTDGTVLKGTRGEVNTIGREIDETIEALGDAGLTINEWRELAVSGTRSATADNSRLGVLGRMGRLGEDVPKSMIDPDNIDDAALQLDRWMINAQIPESTRAARFAEMAAMSPGDEVEMFSIIGKAAKDSEGVMVKQFGVKPDRARKVTAMYENLSDDLRAFDLDDMGNHVDVLAPLRVNVGDQILDLRPMPGMVSELVNKIPLPGDFREIRRLTPVIKQLGWLYDNGVWRGGLDMLTAAMIEVWVPAQLLRGAVLTRIGGEEQLRMAGVGLDSLFRHPASAIAWQLSIDPKSKLGLKLAKAAKKVIDPKGTTTVKGVPFDEISEHVAAMSRGSAGWKGLPGETVTGRYVKARFGDPDFNEGWASQFSKMANDPVFRRVAGGLKEGDFRSIGSKAGRVAADPTPSPLPKLSSFGPGELASEGNLGKYTNLVYRETNIDETLAFLGRTQKTSPEDLFFANTPDLAIGQGKNTGVLIEFDAGGIRGVVNQQKPAWEAVWDTGQAEFLARYQSPTSLSSQVRSITIKKGAKASSKGKGFALQDELAQLEAKGWAKTKNADGSVTYRRPSAAGATTGSPSGNNFDDVAEWFWKGTGQESRMKLGRIEGRSALIGDRSAADAYLKQNYFDRLERITNGNPDLVELVAKGRFGTPTSKLAKKVNIRAFGSERTLMKVLEESYQSAAPKWVGTPEKIAKGSGPGHRTLARLDRVVERGFEALWSRPTNWLARSPTFRQFYWIRAGELIGDATADVQVALIKNARIANLGGAAEAELAAKVVKHGAGTKLTSLDDIDMLARGFALDEVKTLLYDLQKRNQTFDMMRLVFPFGEAWKEIVTSWGRIVRQNPVVIRRTQQALEGLRAPSVFGEAETDPGTGEGFFAPDPQTGEEVFHYPGGAWVSKLLGMDQAGFDFTGRAAGLNMATTTMLPGFGPVAQIPASILLPNTPKWDDVRDVLLPFGEAEGIFDAVTPAWFDKLRTVFADPDPARDRLFANTVADVQRALLRGGDYDMDTVQGQQKLFDDAVGKARIIYAIRGVAQFGLPTGPSLTWNTTDLAGNLVPVKLLADDLRTLTEAYGGNRHEAFTEWVRRYGVDNVLAVIGKSTAIVDRPVTEKGDAWLRAHPEQERAYEMTVGLFAPEPAVGDFDYNAYLRAFATGAREPLSPAEQISLANDFLGRVQWEQAKKIADSRPGPTTSVWLADVRQQIMEAYPGFDGWVSRAIWEKRPKPDEMIAELRAAVTDPVLAETDAGQGTLIYLSALAMADEMVTRLPGNTRHYQQAKSAEHIRDWLRLVSRQIIEEHPDFARMWRMVFERELADDVEVAA